MEELIKEYAKRLKLSWIPRNYHQIQAETFEEYLLKLFENEVSSREERKINRLIKQASFPKIKDAKPLYGMIFSYPMILTIHTYLIVYSLTN